MHASLTAFAALLAGLSLAHSAAAQTTRIGVAAAVRNQVTATLGAEARPLAVGGDVFQNDLVRTGESSVAQLLFARAAVETTGALDPTDSVTAIRFDTSHGGMAAADAQERGDAPSAGAPSPVLSQVDGCTVLRLSGTPFEMGFAHGRAQAAQIRRIVRRYADLAGTRWDTLRDLDAAVRFCDQGLDHALQQI